MVADTISNTSVVPDVWSFQLSSYKVIPNDSSGFFFQPDADTLGISATLEETRPVGFPRTFPQRESGIFFLFFVGCFLLFSLFYRSERNTLFAHFRNVFGIRKRTSSIYKDQVTIGEIWTEIFLLFQTMLVFSMVTFVLFWDQGVADMFPSNRNLCFLGIFLVLVFFVFFRYLGYYFLGTVFFPIKIRNWLEKYLQIVEMIGVLGFFPAFFYIFLPEIRTVFLILLFIIFFMSRLAIIVAVLNIFVKNKIGFLCFIVYLCSVEILPYFLLYTGLVSLITVVGNMVL